VTKPWPWPDSPIKRRERVALSYRALLEKHAPEVCAEADKQMIEYGQRWVVPQVVPYGEDDLLNAEQLADYCGVNVKTVYVWKHNRGLPFIKTKSGIRFVFREVRKWKGSR
jgi:excisionase family DNA binding protein